MEQLGLLMAEPQRRGSPPEHGQDTCPVGGRGRRGESRVCALAAARSPFLLVTQCLLCWAFEVESNRAVAGSGWASLRHQGPAGVAQGKEMLLKSVPSA